MTDNHQALPGLSVIVPASIRVDTTGNLLREYHDALAEAGVSFELIVVLDGDYPEFAASVDRLMESHDNVRAIQLAKQFGEATALTVGLEHSAGEQILTLPAFYQIEPSEIPTLLAHSGEAEMLICIRWPRSVASRFELWRRTAFHRLIGMLSGERFDDLGCGVRLFRRRVMEDINVYGDQHRFLPLLASKRGYSVAQIKIKQSPHDRYQRGYGLLEHLSRFSDIITVLFLLRFTKKPLRLFGTLGLLTSVLGLLSMGVLIAQRAFLDMPLADRPSFLLSSLLIVVGLHLVALGLVGELIIFTHAKDLKDYTIRDMINIDDRRRGDRRETARTSTPE